MPLNKETKESYSLYVYICIFCVVVTKDIFLHLFQNKSFLNESIWVIDVTLNSHHHSRSYWSYSDDGVLHPLQMYSTEASPLDADTQDPTFWIRVFPFSRVYSLRI